jgi:molybdenum cofactor cytidylyltransferase
MNQPPQVSDDANAVYALVLAAGSASRFGSTKQTARYDGIPLVRHAIAVANKACGDRTVLVTGHDRDAVAGVCEPLRGREIINEHYADGLGTSIACGVRAVRDAASAVLILLADQPLVTEEHVQALIDAWSGAENEIVATSFSGTQGPPTLFASGCFDELCALTGDTGGKQLLEDRRFRLRTIEFEPAGVDIDEPEDIERSEP